MIWRTNVADPPLHMLLVLPQTMYSPLYLSCQTPNNSQGNTTHLRPLQASLMPVTLNLEPAIWGYQALQLSRCIAITLCMTLSNKIFTLPSKAPTISQYVSHILSTLATPGLGLHKVSKILGGSIQQILLHQFLK